MALNIFGDARAEFFVLEFEVLFVVGKKDEALGIEEFKGCVD